MMNLGLERKKKMRLAYSIREEDLVGRKKNEISCVP
jgi:hypothetical protein